jgi:hypothetical protein
VDAASATEGEFDPTVSDAPNSDVPGTPAPPSPDTGRT